MSNKSKNTKNVNESSEQRDSSNDKTVSESSNRTEKRSFADDANDENKKMKIESPLLVPSASMHTATSIAPKFVSAATMAQPLPEITDEELLQFTLEFERKHGV